jgi:predicted nucleotidyltransferase
MTALETIQRHRQEILSLAHQHGAKRVRVFGSVARNSATPDSDLDLLVEFDPERSLLDQVSLRSELEAVLCRKVDVVSERGLSPYLADKILQEAVPL